MHWSKNNKYLLQNTSTAVIHSLGTVAEVYLGNALDVHVQCALQDGSIYYACSDANIWSTLQRNELHLATSTSGYWDLDTHYEFLIHFDFEPYPCTYMDYTSNCSFMTFNPTGAPTQWTNNPSYEPSQPPTNNPSYDPSQTPTDNPSQSPSQHPSSIPTHNPSHQPSEAPTIIPTYMPSSQPSAPPIETTAVSLFNETDATIIDAHVRDTQIPTAYIVSIAVCSVFLCIVLCAVYKKRKSANKTLVADGICAQQQVQIQQAIVPISNERIVDETKDESEKEMIKTWLVDSVRLPQHYNLFVDNGYDTLRSIGEIKAKSQLQEIGITLVGHQTRIIGEINRLNEKAIAKKGEESLSEDVDGLDGGALYRNDAEDQEDVKQVVTGDNTLGEAGAIEPPNDSSINAMHVVNSAAEDDTIDNGIGVTIQ